MPTEPASIARPRSAAGEPPVSWAGAWPDLLAFVTGLGLAWWFQWESADLVWSLWLSSLVVGYASIVWTVTGPLRELLGNMQRDRASVAPAGAKAGAIGLYVAGTLFMLGFFTVHFGGFHFGHSVFLRMFFPVVPGSSHDFFDWQLYGEVVARYWWFLPAAFLAEREAFAPRGLQLAALKAASANGPEKHRIGEAMTAPYKNVIRMHLLIFFFAGAHFLKLESFLVYAVVYAVYFFPWRLLRKERAPSPR